MSNIYALKGKFLVRYTSLRIHDNDIGTHNMTMEAFHSEGKTWLNVEGLLKDLEKLIDNRESADVVFLVGKDEVAIYAHRLILVTRCKYFRNRQRELWSSKSAAHTQLTVRKPELRPDVFREVIAFVYTGKVIRRNFVVVHVSVDKCTTCLHH